MSRRRRSGSSKPSGPRPIPAVFASNRVEEGPDGHEYQVRPVAAARATKQYRCPGCDHVIGAGTAHVVVWRASGSAEEIDDRRHWHTPCWANRANRSPTRRWS